MGAARSYKANARRTHSGNGVDPEPPPASPVACLSQVLDPGIIGGVLLPCLGALPDALIVLNSGLKGSREMAQARRGVECATHCERLRGKGRTLRLPCFCIISCSSPDPRIPPRRFRVFAGATRHWHG